MLKALLVLCLLSTPALAQNCGVGIGVGVGIEVGARVGPCGKVGCRCLTCRCGTVIPQRQQAAQKETLIIFCQPSCPPCRNFKTDFAPNTDLGSRLRSRYTVLHVTVVTDADFDKYGIEYTPTFRIENRKDFTGYMNYKEFLSRLERSKNDRDPVVTNPAPPYVPPPFPSEGKDGSDGRPGRDGEDGKSGRDGIDGKPGRAGKDGENGKPGRDAVVDYDKLTESLMIVLEPKINKMISEKECKWEFDMEHLASEVAKSLPKKKYYYDIKRLPSPQKANE